MNEWQPIETMPETGEFLCYRNGIIKHAYWKTDLFGNAAIGGFGWHYPKEALPSHWMPLPPPPKD